ncbi:NAD(P)/FAD-dependent oxidoreductase [Pandoraea sp. NPDC090278]|uniref:NAD(P)/FAD-dependent oxidoreductase n=1 Tax=Pandoraea sp. NPDC090278 TaxID=3364391 RepID=UPI00383A61DE
MSRANRIVIVGGGIAGLMLATRLGRTLGRAGAARVTLVDSHPTHLWKPMLHTVAAGTCDVAHSQVAYLSHACSNGFTYQAGRMSGLDRERREIVLEEMEGHDGKRLLSERRVPYDALVLALGSQADDASLPGVRDVCHFIDSQPQATAFNAALHCESLRSAVNDDALRIVIAGGGTTGVALAAELSRTFAMAAGYGDPQICERLKLTLIERGPRVLGAFPPDVSASTQDQLEQLGFRVLTDTRVVCADRDGFYRDDGQLIPGDLLVWAAGVKAPDCLRGIGGLTTNAANQVVVRATLQTAQDERIFALGDCASFTSSGVGQGECALPPTAQVATQQAAHLGRHLGAWLEGRAIPPFAYRDPGASLSLSGYNAFGALGRFGFFKGGIVRGRFAQWSHAMLYRRHQHALHGFARATVLLGAEKLGGLRGPRIRLA